MIESDLKKLWLTTNTKLEKSIIINTQNTNDISQIKIRGFLYSMKPIKLFAILIGILWVGTGIIILSNIYLHGFLEANKFFLFSATFQIIVTLIALAIYCYQLIMINQVEISDEVLKSQKKLIKLRTSTLWVTRILFLQLPTWTTFWWNKSMFIHWEVWQLIIPISITTLFTLAAIWIFFNIKLENKNKKWFKLIFSGKEWIPLIKSIDLLDQLKE